MKSKSAPIFEEILSLRPKEIVNVKTIWSDVFSRHLVIKVSRKQQSIDLLPLEPFYEDALYAEAPILSVPFSMITEILSADNGDLLFLANQSNGHIISALESM